MARESFQEELEELRDLVLAMGETVAARLRRAVTALETGDHEKARYVRDGDDEINDLYLDIESRCIDLFTLQQPVAGDLRAVAAAFKIITDLERIGDLATNIGAYLLETEQDSSPPDGLAAVGHAVIEQLDDALMAYARRDSDLCHAVVDGDDGIDARCEEVTDGIAMRLIVDSDEEIPVEGTLDRTHRHLLIVRDLERAGDHAVNVAARTLYMVENDASLLY